MKTENFITIEEAEAAFRWLTENHCAEAKKLESPEAVLEILEPIREMAIQEGDIELEIATYSVVCLPKKDSPRGWMWIAEDNNGYPIADGVNELLSTKILLEKYKGWFTDADYPTILTTAENHISIVQSKSWNARFLRLASPYFVGHLASVYAAKSAWRCGEIDKFLKYRELAAWPGANTAHPSLWEEKVDYTTQVVPVEEEFELSNGDRYDGYESLFGLYKEVANELIEPDINKDFKRWNETPTSVIEATKDQLKTLSVSEYIAVKFWGAGFPVPEHKKVVQSIQQLEAHIEDPTKEYEDDLGIFKTYFGGNHPVEILRQDGNDLFLASLRQAASAYIKKHYPKINFEYPPAIKEEKEELDDELEYPVKVMTIPPTFNRYNDVESREYQSFWKEVNPELADQMTRLNERISQGSEDLVHYKNRINNHLKFNESHTGFLTEIINDFSRLILDDLKKMVSLGYILRKAYPVLSREFKYDPSRRLLPKLLAWEVKQDHVDPWAYIWRAAFRKPILNKAVWLQKVRVETQKALDLANGQEDILTAIDLVEPYSVIDKMNRLHKGGSFKELATYASEVGRRLKSFAGPKYFDLLNNRKDALYVATLGYLSLAQYAMGDEHGFVQTVGKYPFSIIDSLQNPYIESSYFNSLDFHKLVSDNSETDSDLDRKLAGFFKIQFIEIARNGTLLSLFELIRLQQSDKEILQHIGNDLSDLEKVRDCLKRFEKSKSTKEFNQLDIAPMQFLIERFPDHENGLETIIEHSGIGPVEAQLKLFLCEALESSVNPLPYREPLSGDYRSYIAQWNKHHADEKIQARLDERNLVISELSHHIKNLNATVREPLENLRNQPGVPENILEDALRGTNLIRNIVNAMNLSIGGAKEDFIFDATHLENESTSLESIIWSALFSAIPNMFDGKHFSKFLHNYFPTREAFREAKQAWGEASASGDRGKQITCLHSYFFNLSVEISGDPELIFGDTKGSATKMLILCQEIMMNAVKYASTMERDTRDLRISVSQSKEAVSITVENSCNTETRLKTAGLGHTVIQNFAKILGCEPQIIKTKERYSLSLEFDNFSHIKQGDDS